MTGPPSPARRTAGATALAAVGTYGALRSWLPAPGRFVGNLVAAATAVTGAWLLGVDREGLGLAPGQHRPGLRWGGLAGGAVSVAVAGLAGFGPARPFFADERVTSHSRGRAAVEASLRIPLETALSEELIFRGALLGLCRQRMGDPAAVAVSSALFGLWHVPPALDALGASAVTGAAGTGRTARLGAVTGTVVTTSLAGAVFAGLRLRSGSLVAPAILHGSLNVAGFAAARRAGAPQPPSAAASSSLVIRDRPGTSASRARW